MVERGPTVILIEHEPALRELEEQVLSEVGYHVETLPEQSDPVTFAKQTTPKVIVIGIQDNREQDWQVVDQLRNDPKTRGISLVVISTSRRTAAQAAASPNVSETVVAPYDISSLEAAVTSALGKPPAAATMPPAPHPVPAYLVIAADYLQQSSRAVVLRAVTQLLRTEPYRSHFQGITPELVDNLGLLFGAIVEGLRKDLPSEQVFATHAVQNTIRGHIRLRKRQEIGLETVIREAQTLENHIDRTLEGFVSVSFSAADALVVTGRVRALMQALVLIDVGEYVQT